MTHFIRIVSIVSVLVGFSTAQASEQSAWGKLICTAVSQVDAVTFAQQNTFLDNWNVRKDPEPPYVAPKGTLSCTLPVLLRKTTDKDGDVDYELNVTMQDEPYRLANCGVTYFDGTAARSFEPDGDGDDDVFTPGQQDGFTAFVDDFNQKKYSDDQFMIMGIGNAPAIAWASEIRGEEPHVPIVTNCHLELPPL